MRGSFIYCHVISMLRLQVSVFSILLLLFTRVCEKQFMHISHEILFVVTFLSYQYGLGMSNTPPISDSNGIYK